MNTQRLFIFILLFLSTQLYSSSNVREHIIHFGDSHLLATDPTETSHILFRDRSGTYTRVGKNGWTLAGLNHALEHSRHTPPFHPTIILLAFGTNPERNFKQSLQKSLNLLINTFGPSVKIYFLGPPVTVRTRQNHVLLKDECAQLNIPYITRIPPHTQIKNDGIHLTSMGYSIINNTLSDIIK